jgi:hypothetical protein
MTVFLGVCTLVVLIYVAALLERLIRAVGSLSARLPTPPRPEDDSLHELQDVEGESVPDSWRLPEARGATP